MKSNIGHLKGAAGAAGMLKTTLALHDKVLPPSLNFDRPNPNVDWAASPFAVNTELRDWEVAARSHPRGRRQRVRVRRHELPHRHGGARARPPDQQRPSNLDLRSGAAADRRCGRAGRASPRPTGAKPPLRGALVLGAADAGGLANELRTALAEARQGRHLDPAAPSAAALRAPERIAIDYADGEELVGQGRARAARAAGRQPAAAWTALRARGIYRGAGAPGKVAFLYTGQGSQYANMLAELRDARAASWPTCSTRPTRSWRRCSRAAG